MIVLSNAGPLIALSKLNRLSLLSELYGTVLIPHTVQGEVIKAQGRPDAVTARLFLQHYRWPVLEASSDVVHGYQPPVVLDAGERSSSHWPELCTTLCCFSTTRSPAPRLAGSAFV